MLKPVLGKCRFHCLSENGYKECRSVRRRGFTFDCWRTVAVCRLAEVEVLGRCCHPNVVRLLAACLTPPRLCLVMELMETSLDKLIHRDPGTQLPLPTVSLAVLISHKGTEYARRPAALRWGKGT